MKILEFINQSPGNTPPFDNPLPGSNDENVNDPFRPPQEQPGHFITLRTKITDGEMLKTALRDLGITVKIEANVRGYNGEGLRTDIVAVLEGEYDLGWGLNSDGSYDLIADVWGVSKKYNQTELINSINYKYAVIKTAAEAEKNLNG